MFRSWYAWIKITVRKDETDKTVDFQKSVLEYMCVLFFKKHATKAVENKETLTFNMRKVMDMLGKWS